MQSVFLTFCLLGTFDAPWWHICMVKMTVQTVTSTKWGVREHTVTPDSEGDEVPRSLSNYEPCVVQGGQTKEYNEYGSPSHYNTLSQKNFLQGNLNTGAV
jgi:hypothetical protein